MKVVVLDTDGVQLLTPRAGIISAYSQSTLKVHSTQAAPCVALREEVGGQWCFNCFMIWDP